VPPYLVDVNFAIQINDQVSNLVDIKKHQNIFGPCLGREDGCTMHTFPLNTTFVNILLSDLY